MAGKRKTIGIDVLLAFANTQLARTDETATKEFKYGICGMIEKALLETNNYNGFVFLDNNNCECDTLGHASRKYLS